MGTSTGRGVINVTPMTTLRTYLAGKSLRNWTAGRNKTPQKDKALVHLFFGNNLNAKAEPEIFLRTSIAQSPNLNPLYPWPFFHPKLLRVPETLFSRQQAT
jgi:hypothetical protein